MNECLVCMHDKETVISLELILLIKLILFNVQFVRLQYLNVNSGVVKVV